MINNSISVKKFNIKKENLEWIAIVSVFIFSLISNITLLVSLILLLILLKQKEVGALKIINLITLRTIINPGIAVEIGNLQNIKWIILFGCSFYLLAALLKLEKKDSQKIKTIIFIMILFTFYNLIIAFVFSSLPIVASFKLISYVFIFLGVLIGVAYTSRYINWIKWMYILLLLLVLGSIFSLLTPSISYLRNGISFQGITNQPNMFGIVSVLFFALFLTYTKMKKSTNFYFLLITVLTFSLVIISQSRTSFIALTLLLTIYFMVQKISYFRMISSSIFTILFLYVTISQNNIKKFILDYLYKGNEESILASRTSQLNGLTENFLQNPWFGNGFAVPVLSNRSYIFSTEYVVEPGNLFISVLSYSGIFGFFIFLFFLLQTFISSNSPRKIIFLPLAAISISMGEMVFFSSNNIGIWCYMLISLYIVGLNNIETKYTLTKNTNTKGEVK